MNQKDVYNGQTERSFDASSYLESDIEQYISDKGIDISIDKEISTVEELLKRYLSAMLTDKANELGSFDNITVLVKWLK